MKYYFFDTSALVKRYHKETGSEKVDKIFDSEERTIIISNLAITEIISAFNKKRIKREISKEDMDLVLSRFFSDVIEDFVVLGLEDIHIKLSIELILKHDIRTLDSLQLSIALGIKEFNLIFVSADSDLCKVAKKEDFQVINPEG